MYYNIVSLAMSVKYYIFKFIDDAIKSGCPLESPRNLKLNRGCASWQTK